MELEVRIGPWLQNLHLSWSDMVAHREDCFLELAQLMTSYPLEAMLGRMCKRVYGGACLMQVHRCPAWVSLVNAPCAWHMVQDQAILCGSIMCVLRVIPGIKVRQCPPFWCSAVTIEFWITNEVQS